MNRSIIKLSNYIFNIHRNRIDTGEIIARAMNLKNGFRTQYVFVNQFTKRLSSSSRQFFHLYKYTPECAGKLSHLRQISYRTGNWPWLAIAGLAFVGGSDGFTSDQLKKFLKACQRGDVYDVLQYIKNGADPNSRHPLGWAALHVAAMNGNGEVVEQLIKAGADVNLPEDYTNIYQTAQEKRMHSIDVMVSRQADFSDDLNLRANFRGCTALHYAVLADDIGVISVLLDAGADPLRANYYGKTPLDYAPNDKIKGVLKKYAEIYAEKRQKHEAEERRKFPLEKRMKEFIVGQEGAITTVAGAIRRKENGWIDDEHPLVFLFLGSSGIGKTELAKQVARYLHKDNKKAFVRLDMSEYQEKHEVAKLIGSPPGNTLR